MAVSGRGKRLIQSYSKMMPVAKKLKSNGGYPTSVSVEDDIKGKWKTSPPMNDASPQNEDEHSDGSSPSEFDDDEEASGDDSGDSLDTDAEIELAQQPSKSSQTLSARL